MDADENALSRPLPVGDRNWSLAAGDKRIRAMLGERHGPESEETPSARANIRLLSSRNTISLTSFRLY